MASSTHTVEHPERLARFAQATSTLSWEPDQRAQSLQHLFVSIGELADAEIRYYYKRRTQGRLLSVVARVTAWILGSLGLLAPLVAATNPQWDWLAKWGYVLLAGSASAIAANSLFGGSRAHTRYVIAQLDLERVLTLFRIDWAHLRSTQGPVPTSEQLEQAFSLFREFSVAFHKILTDETNLWGKALADAIDQYSAQAKLPSSPG